MILPSYDPKSCCLFNLFKSTANSKMKNDQSKFLNLPQTLRRKRSIKIAYSQCIFQNWLRFYCFIIVRFHLLELGLAVFLMICACYDCIYRQDYFFIYIFPQSITFFIMGFGYVGTIIPSQKWKPCGLFNNPVNMVFLFSSTILFLSSSIHHFC